MKSIRAVRRDPGPIQGGNFLENVREQEGLQNEEGYLCECRGPDVGCDHSNKILEG
mgnify:CR=1 FL=1